MAGQLANSAFPQFNAALTLAAGDSTLGNGRFPARNLLLDEGVALARATPYLMRAEHLVATQVWTSLHGDYLKAFVWLARDPRAMHGLDRISNSAETFSLSPDFSRYGSASSALSLVRCEEPRTICNIARRSGLTALADETRLLNLLDEFLTNRTDIGVREDLQEVLDLYSEHADTDLDLLN